MILPISYYGNSILETVAQNVELDATMRSFIDDLTETMHHFDGVGIAAPQVGKSWRIFVVDTTLAYQDMTEAKRAIHFQHDTGIQQVFINPRVLTSSAETTIAEEGCLSIPAIWMDIERPESVTISYTDITGNQHTTTYHGFTARIIQHEYDHLEGILIPARLQPAIFAYYKKQLAILRTKNAR